MPTQTGTELFTRLNLRSRNHHQCTLNDAPTLNNQLAILSSRRGNAAPSDETIKAGHQYRTCSVFPMSMPEPQRIASYSCDTNNGSPLHNRYGVYLEHGRSVSNSNALLLDSTSSTKLRLNPIRHNRRFDHIFTFRVGSNFRLRWI